MRKATTTSKINEALSNNLLKIIKAEIYYKSSGKTENINADRFKESFEFLCESVYLRMLPDGIMNRIIRLVIMRLNVGV